MVTEIRNEKMVFGYVANESLHQRSITIHEVALDDWIAMDRELGRPIPEPRGRLIFA